MVTGRFIFGMGGESQDVAQSTIVAQWFKGKELAFAYGLNNSISSLGTAVNSFLSIIAFESTKNLGTPMMSGFFFCVFSLFCALALCLMDKISDRQKGNVEKLFDSEKFKIQDIKEFGLDYWLLTIYLVTTMTSTDAF